MCFGMIGTWFSCEIPKFFQNHRGFAFTCVIWTVMSSRALMSAIAPVSNGTFTRFP